MKNKYVLLLSILVSQFAQLHAHKPESLFDVATIANKYNLETEVVEHAIERAQKSMQPLNKMIDVIVDNKDTIYHVTRHGVGILASKYGPFYLFEFAVNDQWEHYFVLVKADLDENFIPVFKNPETITLRIDSGCSTGQLFHDQTCECHEQLELAMHLIDEAGEGLIISIPTQDGRGMGTPFKLGTLLLQTELGVNTVESANLLANNSVIDIRTYTGVISVLKFLNITQQSSIRIATNNAEKIKPFALNGYTIESSIPVVIEPTEHTRHHLEAKKEYLGHSL